MRNMNQLVAGASLTTVLLAGAAACTSETSHKIDGTGSPSPTASSSETGSVTDPYCNVNAYSLDEFSKNVKAPAVMAELGQEANGKRTFDGDTQQTSKEVAAALAPNPTALALLDTIENAKSGVVPAKIATDARDEANTLQGNDSLRKSTCARIIARLLKTPQRYTYASPTGSVAIYEANVVGNKINLRDNITPNNASLDVFSIAAASGSANEALDTAVSKSYGITPEGKVIMTANDKDKEVTVSINGEPVQPSMSSSTTVEATTSPTPSPTPSPTVTPSPSETPSPDQQNTGNPTQNPGDQSTGNTGGGVKVGHQGCGDAGHVNCGGGSGTDTGNKGPKGPGQGPTGGKTPSPTPDTNPTTTGTGSTPTPRPTPTVTVTRTSTPSPMPTSFYPTPTQTPTPTPTPKGSPSPVASCNQYNPDPNCPVAS